MAGYEVVGGPCHWDIKFHFLVALGPKLMRQKGYVDDEGSLSPEGAANAGPLKKRFARRLKETFDRFFNPPGSNGKLYRFPPERPCCNFHIDADFEPADPTLDGLREGETRAAMRGKPGQTIIQLERSLTMSIHTQTLAAS